MAARRRISRRMALVTRGPARAGAAPVGEPARAWRAADSSAAARRPPTPLAREPFLKRMFGALIRAQNAGAPSKSPSSNAGRWLQCEKSSIRNTRLGRPQREALKGRNPSQKNPAVSDLTVHKAALALPLIGFTRWPASLGPPADFVGRPGFSEQHRAGHVLFLQPTDKKTCWPRTSTFLSSIATVLTRQLSDVGVALMR